MGLLTPTNDPNSSDYENLSRDVQNLMASINKLNNPSNSNVISTPTATIINNGSSNKAVIGFQAGLQQWGVFVTQDGVDALNNTDLSKFIFNSNQNTFKIVSKRTQAFNYPASGNHVDVVAHKLNYVPLVFAAGNFNVGGSIENSMMPYVNANASSTAVSINATARVGADSSNIFFSYSNILPFSGTITYYILQETATS